MKDFIKVIREIKRTLNFLITFGAIINATFFFLIVYLLLSVINLYPIFAAIPAVIYFLMRIRADSMIDKRKIVESKYKPLEEKLRTAADNLNEENPVVNELKEEVTYELKNVGISSFIDTKHISYKFLAIIMLSFAIVFITTLNLYIVDLNKLLGTIPEILENVNLIKRGNNLQLGEINESSDIYGDSKLAVLGNKEIDIKIKPANYEVNVREEGDIEQKNFDEIFPSEIAIEQASAFEEKIPEEQQELVKNYFKKLAEGYVLTED